MSTTPWCPCTKKCNALAAPNNVTLCTLGSHAGGVFSPLFPPKTDETLPVFSRSARFACRIRFLDCFFMLQFRSNHFLSFPRCFLARFFRCFFPGKRKNGVAPFSQSSFQFCRKTSGGIDVFCEISSRERPCLASRMQTLSIGSLTSIKCPSGS